MSILPSFIKIRRKLAERAARQDRRNQQMIVAVNEMAKSGIGNLTLPGADLLKIIGPGREISKSTEPTVERDNWDISPQTSRSRPPGDRLRRRLPMRDRVEPVTLHVKET
jgi:hypothetical protein